MINFLLICVSFCLIFAASALPDSGKWDFELNQENSNAGVHKTMFAGSKVFVQLTCDTDNDQETDLAITWELRQITCWVDEEGEHQISTNTSASNGKTEKCIHGGHIILNENSDKDSNGVAKQGPIAEVHNDGLYTFQFSLSSTNNFKASLHIEMVAPYGSYLSAQDWPLLPFYGSMCIVYVILGLIWLSVSFAQWRDLLRIQFWIGGVILLGMMEKAMFYAEYQSINSTGVPEKSMVLLAEWVSCAKRTLARMLVIIVSLGFGIVKPRLGSMLHRVVGMGSVYFFLACVESYLRIVHQNDSVTNDILVASIPLAVLDSILCYWIFTSLVQTTRTLRLRRNMVKLALYRHFTNTLIFAVIVSVLFMLYSIKTHKTANCIRDWTNLWIDDAFWHILFSVLLLVIMILWRPTNNNQRYAFTPLLDNPEDDDDDDEDEQFVSDAYGVKMRGPRSNSPRPSKATTNEEDDLRWVEENIPAALHDAALPVLDSDEEVINTKFEVSKMQ